MFRVPNFHNLLASIPSGSKLFTVIDLCSVFFSIPVDKASQFLFAFTWEEKQSTWTAVLHCCIESPSYFSQTLKAGPDSIKFPRCSTLLQYVGDLLLCSFLQASSQEDSTCLLKLLALKGHEVAKEKLQFDLIIRTRATLGSSQTSGCLRFPKTQN